MNSSKFYFSRAMLVRIIASEEEYKEFLVRFGFFIIKNTLISGVVGFVIGTVLTGTLVYFAMR